MFAGAGAPLDFSFWWIVGWWFVCRRFLLPSLSFFLSSIPHYFLIICTSLLYNGCTSLSMTGSFSGTNCRQLNTHRHTHTTADTGQQQQAKRKSKQTGKTEHNGMQLCLPRQIALTKWCIACRGSEEMAPLPSSSSTRNHSFIHFWSARLSWSFIARLQLYPLPSHSTHYTHLTYPSTRVPDHRYQQLSSFPRLSWPAPGVMWSVDTYRVALVCSVLCACGC